MKKQMLFTIIILATLLALAVIGVSTARAQVVTTNAIAGTWYGNMHFSTDNHVEHIQLTIPAGCEPGSVCGSLLNYSVQCTWEITYDGFSSDAYQYHFSKTMKGDCPAGSAGSLSLQPDGKLYRVHVTPMFTASGTLRQLPSVLKE